MRQKDGASAYEEQLDWGVGEDGEYKLGVEAQGRVMRGEILKDEGA